MSFNTATYNAASTAYNTEYPIYIDGTTPTIPIKGSVYYPGIMGNVMCAFAVDGGDSILGGNTIVSGALSVGGNLRVTGNTICSGNVLYSTAANLLFPTTSAVITQSYYNQYNDPIRLIDAASNVVSVANALPNVSYRIITKKNSVGNIFYEIINNTPGTVGTYLNAYNASTNATNYGFIDITIDSIGYVIWGCPFTLSNNAIAIYMASQTAHPLSPTTQTRGTCKSSSRTPSPPSPRPCSPI